MDAKPGKIIYYFNRLRLKSLFIQQEIKLNGV